MPLSSEALRILGVAVAIGLDVLALSTAIGIKGPPWRHRIRLGLSFSAAEILMQIVGLALGTGFGRLVGTIAEWVGLATLAGIGLWILREGFSEDSEAEFDTTTLGGLLLASLSISLDSLGVGFALPALGLPLIPLLSTVAVSTVCFTLVGIAFGAALGHAFEKNAERGAGIVLIAIAVFFAIEKAHGLGAAALPLRPVANVLLPGQPTRLDYESLDTLAHRLFIAHLGDSQVIAVDTQSRRVTGIVPNIGRVHGVLVVPQLRTVFASATATNQIVAIDIDSLRVKARIPGGFYPDGMAYDPQNGRLFVSDEHGMTDTVIDTKTNRRTATIPLGGEVGNTQYDPASGHIFANVQTREDLVEIDPNANRILRRIPLSGCKGNHGLLIDPANERAFIACEDNAALLWLDMRTMTIRGEWKIGDSPDVLALDPMRHRLYVASESGWISVFDDSSSVRRAAQAYYADNAHVIAVDPATHFVYIPLKDIRGHPVLRIVTDPE
jgi:YVTN family beta-propeller protein